MTTADGASDHPPVPAGVDAALVGAARTDLPSLLDLLERLVRLESPSRDEARNRAVADVLAAEMASRGGAVERVSAPGLGDHLVCRFPGDDDREPLLVVGHMDTVHPVGTLERLPWSVGGGRVTGPGAYDMKGGVAVALHAIGLLESRGETPSGPVTLLVTCDEEIGSGHSRGLIEALARESRAALVLEPCLPGGRVKVRRKGIGVFEVAVRGRPAHAGIEPEKGASAVHELARWIVEAVAVADPEIGTTVNVGVVRGGTGTNVVAETASADVDLRFWTREEAERAEAALRAIDPRDPGCAVEVEGGVNRWALERTDASARLYRAAEAVAERLGFALGSGGTGGASDGNLTSGVGCPTLDGLGPDGGGAHTLHEHVVLDDLPRRVGLVAGLLRTL